MYVRQRWSGADYSGMPRLRGDPPTTLGQRRTRCRCYFSHSATAERQKVVTFSPRVRSRSKSAITIPLPTRERYNAGSDIRSYPACRRSRCQKGECAHYLSCNLRIESCRQRFQILLDPTGKCRNVNPANLTQVMETVIGLPRHQRLVSISRKRRVGFGEQTVQRHHRCTLAPLSRPQHRGPYRKPAPQGDGALKLARSATEPVQNGHACLGTALECVQNQGRGTTRVDGHDSPVVAGAGVQDPIEDLPLDADCIPVGGASVDADLTDISRFGQKPAE